MEPREISTTSRSKSSTISVSPLGRLCLRFGSPVLIAVVGVPSTAHIKYQLQKVVPWAFKRYVRRMKPPACPDRPEQLYKWAWDVEKERKEKQQVEQVERMEKQEELQDMPERWG